jgi:SOS-response transcriptional repressor LexA
VIRTTLTDAQREVLRFLWRSLQEDGFPPTMQEVADAFGWASKSAAWTCIQSLARKGYLHAVRVAPEKTVYVLKGVRAAIDDTPEGDRLREALGLPCDGLQRAQELVDLYADGPVFPRGWVPTPPLGRLSVSTATGEVRADAR